MGATWSTQERTQFEVMAVSRKSALSTSATATSPSRNNFGSRNCRRSTNPQSTCSLSRWPPILRWLPATTVRSWRLLFVPAFISTMLVIFLFYWRTTSSSAIYKSAVHVANGPQVSGGSAESETRTSLPFTSALNLVQRRPIEDTRVNGDGLPESREVSIINPHHYRYIMNVPNACVRAQSSVDTEKSGPEVVHLLIYVCSAIHHVDRRLAIRKTWGSVEHLRKHRVVLVFLLGGGAANSSDDDRSTSLETQIREESAAYRDIVREDFIDSYYNLSLKAVMGLKWASHYCPTAAYVMKTDDDVYINVPSLLQLLPDGIGERRQRWIGGCIKQHRSPKPLDADGHPMVAPMGHPPFVAGAGYVISGDIVDELYRASLVKAILPVEDAYVTAYCALSIGVRVRHYEGFNCGEPVARDCDMKHKYVGHHVTPERQYRIWKSLEENSQSC